LHCLGIDFEDWYHPELIQKYVKDKKHEPKMFKGIDKILEMLRKNDTLATFFVVGELLEEHPEIFDKIIENEHEIAFHTMYHTKIDSPNFRESFQNEIDKFSHLTNSRSKGFRAPTFSLNKTSSWIIDFLAESGYVYDSSIVPAKTDFYGIPDAQTEPYRISSHSLEEDTADGKLIEFPLLVTRFLGKKIPAAGGFYLRSLPTKIIKKAIENYEKQKIPASFYIHSWELTPEYMPKIELPFKENFVTYHNINKAYNRMDELLKQFQFTSFSNYISHEMNFSN
jgi:polysaccharide deacetylase family protein (PEP-CTERM system associated)